MTDTMILYAGILCFSLLLAAFGITIWEFHKMSGREQRSVNERVKSRSTRGA